MTIVHLHRHPAARGLPGLGAAFCRPTPQPDAPREGSAARGILLAVAASSFAWLGLALLVPRIW